MKLSKLARRRTRGLREIWTRSIAHRAFEKQRATRVAAAIEATTIVQAVDGPIANGPELQSSLALHTVPMFRFRQLEEGRPMAGSGVLVKIGTFAFILTAGHCVSEDYAITTMGIRGKKHTFILKVLRSGYVLSESGDFGYLEISPNQIGTIEAGNRVFLKEQSLSVLASGELPIYDFLVLAGYPDELREDGGGGTTGTKLFVYSSTSAGQLNAPLSAARDRDTLTREVEVWIPQEGNVDTLRDTLPETALPASFAGASGGGWWRMNMTALPSAWTLERMTLIGTHRGTLDAQVRTDDGRTHCFARVSLIGNHLALIARDYPALSDRILSTWPNVEEYWASLT